MSQTEQIKNIINQKLPSELVNKIIKFRGYYSIIPLCININAINCNVGIQEIYEKTLIIRNEGSYYNILIKEDEIKTVNIILPHNDLELYIEDIYEDFLNELEFSNFNEATLTTEVYFHNEDGDSTINCGTVDEYIELGGTTKPVPLGGEDSFDWIKHKKLIMRKIRLLGKIKKLNKYK